MKKLTYIHLSFSFLLASCAGQTSEGDVQNIQKIAMTNINLVPMTGEIVLEDVAVIQDIRGVMAAGRWYSREALDEMMSLEP